MLMTPIEPPLPPASYRPASYRIVRLVRRWAAGAELGHDRLPSMVRLGRRIGIAPETAIALASMFQLVEACLGRPLQAECCCISSIERDERAILMMLRTAVPLGPHQASPSIPHGLPGALHWAIASVQKLLGETVKVDMVGDTRCPFAD